MRHVEAKAHRRGWDECPPTLMVMRPDAAPTRPYRPVTVPIDWRRVPQGRGMVGSGLMSMAADLTRASSGDAPWPTQAVALLTDMRRHRFAGVMFMSEAWMRLGMTDKARQEYVDQDHLSLADLPDTAESKTVELRQVCAVDTSGTTYFLQRQAGQDVVVDVFGWDDPESMTGNVMSALRLITIAVCEGLPPGEHDIGGLAAHRDAILTGPHLYVAGLGTTAI